MVEIPYKIVLASASPRRKELLTGLGLNFSVRILDNIDESSPSLLQGEDISLFIANKKADAYLETLAEDELLITADTIVYLDGEVLGKPSTSQDATDMLTKLSGKWHQVITGVALCTKAKRHSFAVTTQVKFADLTKDEIEHYVNHFSPLDKAGAYGIQEWIGYIGVEQIKGSYFNVVGLPVQRLYSELKQFTAKE